MFFSGFSRLFPLAPKSRKKPKRGQPPALQNDGVLRRTKGICHEKKEKCKNCKRSDPPRDLPADQHRLASADRAVQARRGEHLPTDREAACEDKAAAPSRMSWNSLNFASTCCFAKGASCARLPTICSGSPRRPRSAQVCSQGSVALRESAFAPLHRGKL